MGRFNLNEILNSASRQAAEGGGENPPRPAESEIKKISVFDLVPSEDNFYSMREIEELKAAIEIAGKVLQNLTVVPLENGKYKVIAGHRRRLASLALVEDGKPQYEFVTCSVEPNEEAAEDQEIRDGLNLIVTNSQREKTAWDKIEEVRYLRDVLEKAKTRPRFVAVLQRIVATVFGDSGVQADGTRDFIAKVLHTSPAQIGRYDTIIRHLSPEFKEELKEDRINLSTAYELAGLPEEYQKAAFEDYKRTGEISIKAARERKPQTTPPPPMPQEVQPERDTEETAPSAEPVRERDKTTPPPAHCIPSTVKQPEIEWDNHTETGTPGDGQQSAQDGPEPQTVKKNTESRGPHTAAAEETERAAEGNTTTTEEEQKKATHGGAWAAEQLESLREYCQSMADSDSDDGSRVWESDVDALDLAISRLRRG